MNPLWQQLKVGDNVRLTKWPSDLQESSLNEETVGLYRWLLATGFVMNVAKVDRFGLPIAEICRSIDGSDQWDYLALNHEGIEIIRE